MEEVAAEEEVVVEAVVVVVVVALELVVEPAVVEVLRTMLRLGRKIRRATQDNWHVHVLGLCVPVHKFEATAAHRAPAHVALAL